jgi:hypothetical protein
MKKKILILFKYPWHWNKFLITKFSKFYEVEYLYVNNIKNKNFSEVIDEINNLIKEKSIEIIFFDVDYFKFVNFYFINKLKNVKKILVTFDDYELHEMNAITANACDLVLTSDPVSVSKYKEKGYQAFYMPLEADGDIFKNHKEKKEIDVLYFGGINPDRKEFLDFITNQGISVKIVGKESNNFATDEELSKLISKSKIVLNFSKSTWGSVRRYPGEKIYKFYYHLKGRIVLTGLCGTACISEFFPLHDMMFNEDELPIFYKKEECVEILKKLLNNSKILESYTIKLNSKVRNLYEDKKNFQPIYEYIENLQVKKVQLIQMPYWYLRICAKMIILRNIKNSSLVKIFSEFRKILPIIRKSNIVTKFLVVCETILNVFWYSIKSFFKRI